MSTKVTVTLLNFPYSFQRVGGTAVERRRNQLLANQIWNLFRLTWQFVSRLSTTQTFRSITSSSNIIVLTLGIKHKILAILRKTNIIMNLPHLEDISEI